MLEYLNVLIGDSSPPHRRSLLARTEIKEKVAVVEEWIRDIKVEVDVLLEEMDSSEISKQKIINGSDKIQQMSRLISEELKNGE